MGIIDTVILNSSGGFWHSIIGWFESITPSFALAIILFTVVLKIVLSPMDFFQKKLMRDNTEKQAELKPEIDKLKKKYKNDSNKLNQKTMELYKRENYSLGGNCLGMVLSLGLTMVIFLTLFFAIRDIGEQRLENQFLQLQEVYQNEQEIEDAEEAVIEKYSEIRESFIWIRNIWRPDTTTSPIPDYETFIDTTSFSPDLDSEDDFYLEESTYNDVMGTLRQSESGWNGLFILSILAALTSFLSQKTLKKQSPKKENKANSNEPEMPNLNILTYILPLLMVYITTIFNSAFAMYIVMNSMMTFIISIASFKILDKYKKESKKSQKVNNNNKA